MRLAGIDASQVALTFNPPLPRTLTHEFLRINYVCRVLIPTKYEAAPETPLCVLVLGLPVIGADGRERIEPAHVPELIERWVWQQANVICESWGWPRS